MVLIQTVSPENAEGEVKEIYQVMQKNVGGIPAPLELASASPWMLGMVWQYIQYYSQQWIRNVKPINRLRYTSQRAGKAAHNLRSSTNSSNSF